MDRTEIQLLNNPEFHSDTGFAFRILINDKEVFVTELTQDQKLHIGAILLNAARKFINNFKSK